ncbi:MAG: hypothetical protein Q9190_004091 [Brigantiaea leucoxantha]
MTSGHFRQRRLKPSKEDSDDEIYSSGSLANDSDTEYSSVKLVNDGSGHKDGSAPSLSPGPDSLDDSQEEGQSLEPRINIISFGALAKAQESLQGKRKKRSVSSAILPSHRHSADASTHRQQPQQPQQQPQTTHEHSRRHETKNNPPNPTSSRESKKHAPATQSSKKPVSRKREIIPTLKRKSRDPRFESFTGNLETEKTKKDYAFLDGYRDTEMSELRAAIPEERDVDRKEKLKRALLSMESRKKTRQDQDQREEVMRVHRETERERVRQGKRPFYLKRAETKKLALVQRFEDMKGKEVEKALQRRRKRKTAKERRAMPERRKDTL